MMGCAGLALGGYTLGSCLGMLPFWFYYYTPFCLALSYCLLHLVVLPGKVLSLIPCRSTKHGYCALSNVYVYSPFRPGRREFTWLEDPAEASTSSCGKQSLSSPVEFNEGQH